MVDTLSPSCVLKVLPAELAFEAARTAVWLNPANAPATPRGFAPLEPAHLAALTSKLWPASGIKLTVGFLDNPSQGLRTRILAHANAWSKTGNIEFTFSNTSPTIRVARTRGQGYYSYLGTDNLHIPPNQATLNLDSFSDRTPESEFFRVVRHEFGHALGFAHEHLRREIVARINVQAAIAYFGQTQGWSPQDVQDQVLTPLDEGSIRATTQADSLSIMCYQLPAQIMADGVAVHGGDDIDELDYGLIGQLYPRLPPPPPGPTGGWKYTVRVDPSTGAATLTREA